MDAIIIGGGVAKGAFAAGALSVLGKAGLRVRRIVGTSSGAICAAYLARAVRSGTEATAGDELARLWLEDATLAQGFSVSPRGILRLEGISTARKLIGLLREHIAPATAQHGVDLRLIATNLAGQRGPLSPGREGTTFERVLHFHGTTFDDAKGLEGVFGAVAASASFPGAFVPYPLLVDGRKVPCIDGGVTDNTPVKQAIDGAPEVDRIFVIVPYPALLEPPPPPLTGLSLLAQVVEVLVQERLYRDLREAYAVNATLAKLEAEVPDPTVRAAVLRAFGWSGRRRLEIVEIRPFTPLEGGAFDGFLSRRFREDYIASGRTVARAWLAARAE